MNKQLIALLEELTNLPGPPGQEDAVRERLIEEFKTTADELYVDRLGNLVAVKHGRDPALKLMVEAHMDEVGLIVKQIDRDGYLLFEKNGSIDDKVLPAREVDVLSRHGLVRGVIGNKGRHLQTAEDLAKLPSYRDMWIDVGVASDDEARDLGIEIGSGAVFATRFQLLDGGRSLVCKALDNRMGCAVIAQALRDLAGRELPYALYAVIAVQEEIGARGARAAAFGVDPQIAIVLDTAHGEDPTSRATFPVRIGRGPSVRLWDMYAGAPIGTISDRRLSEKVIAAANRRGLPFQRDVLFGTYLDASSVHLTRAGIPTASLCLPRRYSHSPCDVARTADLDGLLALLLATLEDLGPDDFVLERRIK